jgi:hypothetical protein
MKYALKRRFCDRHRRSENKTREEDDDEQEGRRIGRHGEKIGGHLMSQNVPAGHMM